MPMRLGLISDTHDESERTASAIRKFEARDVDAILHMGDTTSAETLHLFAGWRAWFVRGNMDLTPATLEAAAAKLPGDVAYDITHDLELGGLRVGVAHGHEWERVEGMVNAGAFDLVLHGHTHRFRDETVGRTRVINPGAVHSPRAGAPQVCVLDTATGELERVQL